MKVILHAGLHKTGTTSVQANWRAAYGEPGPVWYPRNPDGTLPGHHKLVWPLLGDMRGVPPVDIAWAAAFPRPARGFAQVLREAKRHGVETLVISSEELDRLRDSDAKRFMRLLGDHELVFALTVTRPFRRWCSAYQMLVKHGLAEYPADAAGPIMNCASLGPGRVQELLSVLPAARRVVRVVRTSPHEEDLSRDLAEALGLEWPDIGPAEVRNVSIGTETEILRRVNRMDLALGTTNGDGRRIVRRMMRRNHEYHEPPGLAERYEPPAVLWESAEAERRFLAEEAADHGVEVLDPHGELDAWLSREAPGWYDEVSRRELVVDRLESPEGRPEQLWRVRQERAALRVKLARAEKEIAALRAEVEAAAAREAAAAAEPRDEGLGDRLRRRVRPRG